MGMDKKKSNKKAWQKLNKEKSTSFHRYFDIQWTFFSHFCTHKESFSLYLKTKLLLALCRRREKHNEK